MREHNLELNCEDALSKSASSSCGGSKSENNSASTRQEWQRDRSRAPLASMIYAGTIPSSQTLHTTARDFELKFEDAPYERCVGCVR